MHWLHYVFFGLMFGLGAAVFVIHMRAKLLRAWIWALVALVGAAGLVAVATETYQAGWRQLALSVVFALFALDHAVQYLVSKRAGAPQNKQLMLAAAWLTLGVVVTL